jgi:hypothetical protein
MQSNDPKSLMFDIPKGSILTLNKNLQITEGKTHAMIQGGKLVSEKARNQYDISCRLDVREFGPRTIKPEVFTVSRTEDGSEWVSYPTIKRFYTIVYLQSSQGTDVIKLDCEESGERIDRNFTVAEMQAALGDVFTFNFNVSK